MFHYILKRNISKVFKILELPDKYCFPLVGLILGYSDVCSESQRGRLSGEGIVHWETYHRLTDSEKAHLVFEYDDKNKNLGVIFGDLHKNGIEHYLDWFYSKWSISRPSEKARLYSAIRSAGFF